MPGIFVHTQPHSDSVLPCDGNFIFSPELTEQPHEQSDFLLYRNVAGNKAVFVGK